jgi:putative PIN family toxin of toxin-antitoxin system
MIRVVIDTNVLVSANIKTMGAEARVLDLVAAGRLQLYVSQPILAEYQGVLTRPKLRLDPKRVQDSLDLIQSAGIIIEPQLTLAVSPDEPDNRFLECAETAQADYLVTGNKRHFPKQWQTAEVVNARELLERITPQLQRASPPRS